MIIFYARIKQIKDRIIKFPLGLHPAPPSCRLVCINRKFWPGAVPADKNVVARGMGGEPMGIARCSVLGRYLQGASTKKIN